MGKNKKSASRITKTEKYLSLFPDDEKSNAERKRFQALKEAQDVRKFEIDLYWKRTGFFWAFITIIYTAFFHVLCKYIECPDKYALFVPVISTLSGLGFFFSVAWHMVNKGSKFWQENWEKHVSLLEKSEIGPLYDVFLNPKETGSRWKPTKAFDFSVTKVNMWASFTICICSFCGWVGIDLWLIFDRKQSLAITLITTLVPSAIMLLSLILMVVFSDGNTYINIDEPKLDMIHRH